MTPSAETEASGERLRASYRDFTQDSWGLDERHKTLITRFRRENGRAPRILHIGNIANNGFKNAHVLRKHGIECDALCFNYFHVMGCPEWELAEFATEGFNFDAPEWSKVDLGGYERPRWFVQGNFVTAIDYLIALRTNSASAAELWQVMALERDSAGREHPGSSQWAAYDYVRVRRESERLAALFKVTFPDRAQAPTAEAIAGHYGAFLNETERLKRLFSDYDMVIGYASDGVFPLIAGKVPYACFEHGTIRTFPFDDTLFGQMCALCYANASDVLISNCDNIVAARRLKLGSFRFLPHAMLEDFRQDPVADVLRADLLANYQADFIVFHPSRQHWSTSEDLNWEKGNDRLIRAFARFVAKERPGALLIMVAWGQTVDASKNLVAELGIAARVVWLEPKPMRTVGQYVAAADVLADQFVIGAWGAIMPHGMMLGTPTMLHLDETLHEWCFPSMPPVLNTRTVDDIHAALVISTQPEYRNKIKRDGIAWHDRYHSETVVAGRLLDSLATCLEPDAGELMLARQRLMHAELLVLARGITQDNMGDCDKAEIRHQEFLGAVAQLDNKVAAIQATISSFPPTGSLVRVAKRLSESQSLLGRTIYHALRIPWRAASWLFRKLSKFS